ncbi:hypothetical protein [Paenibacillus jilunlii]|uniref:Uncharacterized protein n=1 Tax=Paenibacillus jilunlii TaxID=682956 RepID=A0A1H0A022_9BACL|nr:hypothetical protein [Paenibacillus jilunlii]KWX79929.1 hypothetical protein AML91_01810 [Paenibacillus jilunlii]SDN26785.1 hypothetical protein SAMN05216191_13416 [Paenibacillus jilunlii]
MNNYSGNRVYGEEDAIQKAYLAKREIEYDPDIIIKIECYNEEEYNVFKKVFSEILGAEVLAKSVCFTWLSF